MRVFRTLASVIALGLILTGCSTNPSTGRSQLILLSSEQLSAMGAEAKPQMVQEFGGEVSSPQLRNYVSEVGNKVAAHVEPQYRNIQWDFVTLNSDVINAFALPGGHIFVTRGLLSRMTNEAQLAAVLGHEVGHVTGRHADERVSQSMAAQGLLIGIGTATESQVLVEGANSLANTVLLSFSRDQEDESDWQGIKYMVRANYDPQGMVQLLQILIDASQGQRPPEMTSTHPYPENRLRDVQKTIETKYANTQGSSSYRLQERRFRERAGPYL